MNEGRANGQRPGDALVSRSSQGEHAPLIQVRDLTLTHGDKPALEGVNLGIHRGVITAIVGPSGCGKSSFLMALNRLSDHVANARVSGSIHIDGEDVLGSDCDVVALRRRVGMIFQKPNPFPFSIRKNLTLPLREHGVRERAKVESTIERCLRDVGLWDEVKDRLDAPALSLSGGQQQRLCLARALAIDPEVLLLDEPCSALDPMASGIVEDLIVGLRGRYTVLIVTHNLAQARRIADHVAVFWVRDGSGRLIEYGTALQVFESPEDELTKAYVGGLRG